MLEDIIKFITELLNGKEFDISYKDTNNNDEMRLVQQDGLTRLNANLFEKNVNLSIKDPSILELPENIENNNQLL